MKQIVFLVLVLVAVASAQTTFGGHYYTGPINHGIYGPYDPYGPYGRNGFYTRIGTYGPVGTFGQGINPSIYHIANSFFSKIQRRVENAYISPAQIPKANEILLDARNNFKTCETEYIIVQSIPTYKQCLQIFVNKASADVRMLEGANQPANLYNNILYPQTNSKPLDDTVTHEPDNMNSIKTSTEIED